MGGHQIIFKILALAIVLISMSTLLVSGAPGSRIQVEQNPDFIEIPQGRLTWNTLQSREGRDYYSFYKIPYAKPPLGNLRFQSPERADGWEGIRAETEVSIQCIQKNKYAPIDEAVGDEDCLYLNIYTPKIPQQNMSLLPTLFYIHGGGFTDGNGSRYGGKYFMDEDAVLVTFQYRLGVFGFLSSEDGTIKGNMGFKDQVMALRWVQENIIYFGGDSNRVMIFGNSAGGVSVSQLMASPMAAGLFHRAITQSGPALSSTTNLHANQLQSFRSIANKTGCLFSNQSQHIVKCLREKDAKDLAVIRGSDIMFFLTIESYESDDESDKYMPDSLYNMFKTGRVNKVPWIIGVNSAEYVGAAVMLLLNHDAVDSLNNNWNLVAPTIYMTPYSSSPAADAISNKTKDFYFGDKQVSNDTLKNFESMLSDRDIIYSGKIMGSMMAEIGESDVFFYYMSKRPQKSYFDPSTIGYPPGNYGASHADELQYIFNYAGYPEYFEGSEYYNISRNMIRIWVQFASTGIPEPGWNPILPCQNPQSWYELNDNLGHTTTMQERMDLWDQFSPEELLYV